MKYRLGDLTVNNWNDWDRVPRMPEAVGGWLLSTVFGSAGATLAATTFLGVTGAYLVGYVAITAVTSWALSALAPKPDFSSFGSQGTLVNERNATSPADFVYGEVRKGGTVVFYESTGEENKYLHQVIALAGHEVNAIGDIYINDEIVTLDANGFVTSDSWVDEDGNSKIRIRKYRGDQTAVDIELVNGTSVTSSFVGNGIASLYVRYEYDPDVFANGLPLITAKVQGKKVFDPRTGTTAYSNNAALCMRDFLVSEYGLNDSAIDDVSFSVAANESDENVALAGGGTEKRYTINGIVKASSPIGKVLGDMSTACAGTLFWGSGYWKLKVGAYSSPVKTLTLDDLRGPISMKTRTSMRDSFNGVSGTFNDAEQDFITADYPPIQSDIFKAEDGGDELMLDLPLPFTTSASAAQRLAKLTLYRAREQISISADFGLNAFDIEVGDIIAFDNERYGFDGKEFEVMGWRFESNQDAGDLRVNLTLQETSASAFDWNAEETAIIANNTTLPDFRYVPPVGLSVIGAELRLANQQVVGAISVDVTLDPLRAAQLEFQYRQTGAANWIPVGSTNSVFSRNRFEVVGVSDGFFDFRARAINGIGVRGRWKTITGYYATLFTAPPQNVTNFAANVVGNTVHLTWTPTEDLDLSHYKIRFANATSGASYQNAFDLVAKVSRPANSITVPAQTGTYFIKAVDKLGNVSPAPASIVVTTNTADIDNLNVVETLQQDPSFSGAKTNVIRLNDDEGNYLALDTLTLFDGVDGEFDEQAGLFDGGGGGSIHPIGFYEFDRYIDLGQKYVSRVSASMDIRYLEYADTFDAASDFFDSREGDFDGDPSQFDTTTARTQVSYTDDDPAGSPIWSDWRDFIVGDIAARAIRFRVELQTSSDSATPAVRELTATVDMPDRVESEDDITYTGSQVVTFPAAFVATPAIGIAASLADGDRYVISNKTRAGFTITTFTGVSVSSNSVTFDYVAKGYGKEIA